MNFQEFEELINSGSEEITLTEDVILDDEESEYSKGINLGVDDLVIDGKNHIIDACGKTRIFYCNAKNVLLKNIVLTNAFSDVNGGAIYNGGELTIKESIIKDSTSNDCGGAINNDGATLNIVKSKFINNIAKRDNGGAIDNENGILTIFESIFRQNTAPYGGAISSNCELVIDGCGFEDNKATASSYSHDVDNYGLLSLKYSYSNNSANRYEIIIIVIYILMMK